MPDMGRPVRIILTLLPPVVRHHRAPERVSGCGSDSASRFVIENPPGVGGNLDTELIARRLWLYRFC